MSPAAHRLVVPARRRRDAASELRAVRFRHFLHEHRREDYGIPTGCDHPRACLLRSGRSARHLGGPCPPWRPSPSSWSAWTRRRSCSTGPQSACEMPSRDPSCGRHLARGLPCLPGQTWQCFEQVMATDLARFHQERRIWLSHKQRAGENAWRTESCLSQTFAGLIVIMTGV
jgi:hypothetical protein